jgi:hypothetical protein
MMSNSEYRLWVTPEDEIDVEASGFTVEDGVLLFHDTDKTALTKEPVPFAAYKEWHSVIEL